jgi:hypothetical protein
MILTRGVQLDLQLRGVVRGAAEKELIVCCDRFWPCCVTGLLAFD